METKSRKFRLRKPLSYLVLLLSVIMFTATAYGQVNVSGSIVDESNAPMFGVTVVEKGTTNGIVSDLDGKFSLTVKNESSVLRFSSIGYKTQEIALDGQTSLNVVMEEDLALLDEVVVTGYGVQKKSDLTGAVSSVSGENLRKVPIANIDQAMQGQAAGVHITSKSGRPGEESDIQIRGISSINGTQPLIVIDGIPGGSMNDVNPNDIASIEVLKDASSSAIYGATGGNGVILITTKEGEAGKITTNVNVYRGIESSINKIEMMNAQEFMQVQHETEWNKKVLPKYRGLENEMKRPSMFTSQPDTLIAYDYQDEVFETGITENYDISVSGGSDVAKVMVSASYANQEGIIRNTGYERFTFRINSEQKLTKRITLDQKVSVNNSVEEGAPYWVWHQYYNNPVYFTMLMDPVVPPYDSEGNWSESFFSNTNPLVALDMYDRTQKNVNLNGNFGLNLNLFKGFNYTARFAGTLGFGDLREYEGTYYATTTNNRNTDKLIRQLDRSFSYTMQHLLNYNTTIADAHNLSVMAGMEANKWWGFNMYGVRVDMASSDPNMLYFDKSTNSSDDQQNVSGTGYIGATMAYFGRVNYDYDGKYLLTFNIRRDGSSSFGPDNRWGIFPSFSVGWKFTEEGFMENVDAISFGKLRFGYGQTGTNARTGFPYLAQIQTPQVYRYVFNQESGVIGAGPLQIANPAIHWETVTMSNIGVDLTFLNNRISFTADLFDKMNDGMLMSQELPRIAGTFYQGADDVNPEANIGSIRNMGYEITVGARKSEGDLKGSVNFNISGVKNEVISLATDSMVAGRVHSLSGTNITMEGAPISQFYGFETEGLFQMDTPHEGEGMDFVFTDQPYTEVNDEKVYAQPMAYYGDVRYKDQNEDGVIDDNDKVILGSPLPKFTYGISFNLEYKGFDFSAFFNGTYGNKILNGLKQYTYHFQEPTNRQKDFGNRFVPYDVYALNDNGEEVLIMEANHDTDIPRNAADNYGKLRPWFIEDGSYLRLRNVVLGYTIPEDITAKINVERIRVYGGARNPFTLTKYTGLSPEVAGKNPEEGSTENMEMGVDLGVYPVTKMFYFGLNLTF